MTNTEAPKVTYVPLTEPTITIEDTGGTIIVVIDRNDGHGRQLSASYPSGRGAAYAEARERGYAEAMAKAEDRVAFLTLPRADYDARSRRA